MLNATDMLDEEYAGYFGCQPEDLRAEEVTVLAGGPHPLAIAATSRGGLVSSNLVGRDRLAAALGGRSGKELFGQVVLRRLIGILPARDEPWSISEENVLFYCTVESFRPCVGLSSEPVRPDDAFWQEAREGERDFAEEGRKWHVEAAFALYVGSVRVSTAKLIDNGRHHFRAVGVGTDPDYRGRGYAKACVSAVTAWALGRDLVPLYNTQTVNEASVAVAQALGYAEYIWHLDIT